MVTIENYEEYLMLAADGELDAAGKEALDVFLAAHPELAGEAATWASLHLQPDEQIVFAEKETLLRKEPKLIALNWKVYALGAAASLVLTALLLPRLWQHEMLRVAHHMPASVPPPVAAADGHTHPAASTPVQKALLFALHQATANRADETLALRGPEVLAALPVAGNKSIDVAPLQSPSLARLGDVPQAVLAVTPARPEHNPALPELQFAVANGPAIELFKQGIEMRAAQVAALAHSIKETALVVRLGNGTVNLNF